MSAAASGHVLFYNVVSPTEADLTDVHPHGRLRQRADICWSSSRAFEEWHIRKIRDDKVTIAPLRGRSTREVRCKSRSSQVSGVGLREEYKGLSRGVC